MFWCFKSVLLVRFMTRTKIFLVLPSMFGFISATYSDVLCYVFVKIGVFGSGDGAAGASYLFGL